jgi:hypothetical protein
MKRASDREAIVGAGPFTMTGLRTRRNAGAAGPGYSKLTTFACSCSAPEHDHKLFPRPRNAIIDSGNDDPDLVGASWGMGTEDRGRAL